MNLTIKYAGLELKNPIIVGASNLTDTVDKIVECEKNGAGAVVLKSLFEEQIMYDVDSQRVNNIFNTYKETENYVGFYTKQHNVQKYLDLIAGAKEKTNLPVIASINCVTANEWTFFAKKIQDAGADALELNMFIMPADEKMIGEEVENIYISVITKILKIVTIPVTLKIHSYFSGFANFLQRLSETEIKGIVLFNRFYSPEINLVTEKIISSHIYSSPHENSEVLRWLGIMSHKVSCDLAASTGVHSGQDVAKNLLAGAKATQVVSALYLNGMQHITTMKKDLEKYMESKNYTAISDFQGKLNQSSVKRPMIYERAQFMKYFSDLK